MELVINKTIKRELDNQGLKDDFVRKILHQSQEEYIDPTGCQVFIVEHADVRYLIEGIIKDDKLEITDIGKIRTIYSKK